MLQRMKLLCCWSSFLALVLVWVPAMAASTHVRIAGSLQSFGLLQQAYDGAASGAVIQAQGIIFVENLSMVTVKDVTMQGGFDPGFSAQNTSTVLQGVLTVARGSLVADHLTISGSSGSDYTVSGSTTTSTGTVIPGATITIAGPVTATMAVDSNGAYSFTGIANGSYTINASLNGYSFNTVLVTVNNADAAGQNITGASTINSQYTVYVITPTASYDIIGAYGISDAGVIAGYAHATGGLNHAALWTGGIAPFTLQDLNSSGAIIGAAYAISGSQTVGAGTGAVLWTGTTASTAVNLSSSGEDGDVAFGVSGSYIVGRSAGSHALLWSGSNVATLTDLHPAGYFSSEATGVSGTTTVGSALDYSYHAHAFAWTGTTGTIRYDLTPIGYKTAIANAVSGTTIVGSVFNGTANHAALWTETSSASFVDIHPAMFSNTQALAISGLNAVGLGNVINSSTTHALLWTGTSAGSVIDLHSFLPSATVTFVSSKATGVNNQRDIVGTGVDTMGKTYIIVWKRNIN
jgi:hypothetical protein